jgi:hypothetical protein
MQLEDIMNVLSEINARLIKLSKRVEEIFAIVLAMREEES